MTTLTAFPTTDPRGAKAVAIAADAGQWIKVRARDGAKYYGIRSSADSNVCYLVNRSTCTCADFFYGHECKHVLAVRLWCEMLEMGR